MAGITVYGPLLCIGIECVTSSDTQHQVVLGMDVETALHVVSQIFASQKNFLHFAELV